jgi:hypothetical protein
MPDEHDDDQDLTWLTMHEVLDRTTVSYRQLEDLAAQGAIRTRRSGAATLYCAEDLDGAGS